MIRKTAQSRQNERLYKRKCRNCRKKAKILQKLYASINDYFAGLYSGGVLTEGTGITKCRYAVYSL